MERKKLGGRRTSSLPKQQRTKHVQQNANHMYAKVDWLSDFFSNDVCCNGFSYTRTLAFYSHIPFSTITHLTKRLYQSRQLDSCIFHADFPSFTCTVRCTRPPPPCLVYQFSMSILLCFRSLLGILCSSVCIEKLLGKIPP